MSMSSNERAFVAEQLLCSLETPDSEMDAVWIEEVEARLTAVKNGQLRTLDAESVFGDE